MKGPHFYGYSVCVVDQRFVLLSGGQVKNKDWKLVFLLDT